MNKQEKENLARVALKRNGYSDEEIEKIIFWSFGDKKLLSKAKKAK